MKVSTARRWNKSECGKKGLVVKPKTGHALPFRSMTPNATLDRSRLHGGCPAAFSSAAQTGIEAQREEGKWLAEISAATAVVARQPPIRLAGMGGSRHYACPTFVVSVILDSASLSGVKRKFDCEL
ncbi:hypothetical protein V6N12_057649 [Hibiscus sabdariffa]|uniref:Uncharacterized protein n=1 Tax=Hibiscus sabdariffa TaxID=183260 RepID=A0ABR2C6G6_9ROSI